MKRINHPVLAFVSGWLVVALLYLPHANAESVSSGHSVTTSPPHIVSGTDISLTSSNIVKVVVLSQEEYDAIVSTLPEGTEISVQIVDREKPYPLAGEADYYRKSAQPTPPVDVFIDELVVDLLTADWGKGDLAIVIFVVIGLVVTISVVAYTGYYVYQLLTGGGHDDYWFSADLKSTFLVGSGTSGHASGIKFGAGFENSHRRVGALLETGYLDMKIRPKDIDTTVRPKGAYFLAGAGVRWMFDDRVNPSWIGMELLAGTATDKTVKLMSVARATLNLAIGSRGRLGLTVGAMSLGLDIDEGILQNRNQFATLLGLETGIRF